MKNHTEEVTRLEDAILADDTPALSRSHLTEQLLSSFAINILSLALPIMTLQIYDRLLATPQTGTLSILMTGVGVIILMEMLLRLGRSYLNGWTGMRFEHQLTCAAMRHLLMADPVHTQRLHTGELLSELNAAARLRDCYSGQVWLTLIDLPFALLFLGMIAYLAGWLVMAPLVLLAAFCIIAWAIGASLKGNLLHRDASDERRYNLLIEALESIHTIKAQGLEKPFLRRYEALQGQANPLNYQVAQTGGMAATVGALFGQLMMVAVVSAGAPFVIGGAISTGTLIACVLLSGRIMQPVQRALTLWARMQDFRLAQERIDALFALPTFAPDPQSRFATRDGVLQLREVAFAYPGQKPLFAQVNLTLKRGESAAIAGGQSNGKTSLLKVAAGLYAPTEGTATLDGFAATAYAPEQWMEHVAYLPADGLILRGTILDNLTGFRPERRAAAYEIAEWLGLSGPIARLPMGYDTLLEGAIADAIPPGVKQRIAIGRALLPRPRILLFDHADRALDRDGYHHVFRLLGRLRPHVAMLIVSDDRNLLSLADRLLHLQDGRLAADADAYREARA